MKDGNIVSTSLDVSKSFEKRHDHVMRDIRNIINRNPEFKTNFTECETKDSYGRKRMIYDLSEEGLNILKSRYSFKQRKKSDLLYILKHKNINDYYKIGITYDIEARIKQLSTASPFGIEVIKLIHNDKVSKIEKELHNTYSNKRLNGEWFKLTNDELNKIINDIKIFDNKGEMKIG